MNKYQLNREKAKRLKSASSYLLTLYSDGKSGRGQFGITNKEGYPLWYGKYNIDDINYSGTQPSCEIEAAKKAVELVKEISEEINETISLNLFVDAEWLLWANEVKNGSKKGGQARPLGELALNNDIYLTVAWIKGTDNPADEYTICEGEYKEKDLIGNVLLEKK